ncbi:glycosyltransferase family 2 protein [uncultured Clostridium sp.]|uniref:glycosyltransferase family 2 protein n=1 Tax=uncultured Clostridium sp. TaxID=59620 RepID=UPI002635F8AF|nr:glycosyltransferase family 2 protein [uncultured Clostridium sp.]
MLVSVVLPCYNAEKYLKETVKSVINQDYDDMEIILVNDGSTDSTLDLMKKLENKYSNIRYISQVNQGVSVARNAGMDVAKGKYISFLDADDTYEVSKISKEVHRLLESGKQVCYCGNSYIFNNKIVKHNRKKEGKLAEEYIYGSVMHLNDFMIDINFLRKNDIRYSKELECGEDSEFIMKILLLEEAVYVPELLSNYFIRGTSSFFNRAIRENDKNNYINNIKHFIINQEELIYTEEEKKKIITLLDTFLLPQVVARNISYCKKKKCDLSSYEKMVLSNFKFNKNNIKSSIKFYIIYFKIKFRFKLKYKCKTEKSLVKKNI